MKFLFLAFSLFGSQAFADIYYQSNTQVPADLQVMIAPLVGPQCPQYKPHWRIFEGERTFVEGNSYFIVFNVEAYDLDEMHPYYRSMVVSAKKVGGTYEIADLICN